jgi:hypothetical protein
MFAVRRTCVKIIKKDTSGSALNETCASHVPYYLLSYGGKIRIIEPPELKACLADQCFRIIISLMSGVYAEKRGNELGQFHF